MPCPLERESLIPFVEGYKVRPEWTFENFIVGSSNSFAYTAAKTVAESFAKSYNPFFIYGGEGLGKTHLAGAIYNYITDKRHKLKTLYYTAEQFFINMITAIKNSEMLEFWEKYKSVDVLFIDDIQFLANKPRTQEELFNIVKSFTENQKQVIVTCDRHPKKIKNRLRSLFKTGLIAKIQPPEFETRISIIHKEASMEGIDLPENVANLIASEIKTNIREMKGCLIRLQAEASLTGKRINAEMVKSILEDFGYDIGNICMV